MIRGRSLRTVSYIPHVKDPVMEGHLSCRNTILTGVPSLEFPGHGADRTPFPDRGKIGHHSVLSLECPFNYSGLLYSLSHEMF